jgi:HUS1 checkpoint protein
LKSAQNAYSASLRLTKKDNVPLLSLTIIVPTPVASGKPLGANQGHAPQHFPDHEGMTSARTGSRETTITQDITVRVLAAAAVEGIHEPRCPEPEVHILLPPLLQLKSISERFTRLAMASVKGGIATGIGTGTSTQVGLQGGIGSGPRLEIAANMHGELRIGIRTEALNVQSRWSGLSNPELDPTQVEGGAQGVANHPSTRMREVEGDEAWAVVRVEGRDWGRVLGIGRMGGRVVACE